MDPIGLNLLTFVIPDFSCGTASRKNFNLHLLDGLAQHFVLLCPNDFSDVQGCHFVLKKCGDIRAQITGMMVHLGHEM